MQVADAIETGVARAAALASSMSVEALSHKLAERKRAAAGSQSPPLLPSPQSPGATPDADGSPAVSPRVGGPISARFPAFKQRSRGSSPSASCHASQAEEVHAPLQDVQMNLRTTLQPTEDPVGKDSLAPLRAAAAMATSELIVATDVPSQLPALQMHSTPPSAPGQSLDEPQGATDGVDGARGTMDAALQSPMKKARGDRPLQSVQQYVRKPALQHVHDSLTAGLDVAILSAMAVPRAALDQTKADSSSPAQEAARIFGSGGSGTAGSAPKVSPRSRKAASRSSGGGRRARAAPRPAAAAIAPAILEPLSGGASSCGSGQLALAGQEFESALFDSDASR